MKERRFMKKLRAIIFIWKEKRYDKKSFNKKMKRILDIEKIGIEMIIVC